MTLFIGIGEDTSRFPVTSYAQASAWWCDARDRLNLGARNSPHILIYANANDATPVAHVSYNGRVWEGVAYWANDKRCLYEPGEKEGTPK